MAENSSIFPSTFFQNPYPFYAQLRANGPVVPQPDGRVFITSHRHVKAVLADRRLLTKKSWSDEQGLRGPTVTVERRMGEGLGVDIGLERVATLSDGAQIATPRPTVPPGGSRDERSGGQAPAPHRAQDRSPSRCVFASLR